MAFAQRHLLGLEGVSARGDHVAPRHRGLVQGDLRARHQEGADAARQDGGQPLLRGQHPHADLVRDRRQAAVGRHDQHHAPRARARSKGETLLDTARNLEAMRPDAIVVRHPSSGAPQPARARTSSCPIINAGDGCHEHPTQALLDCSPSASDAATIAGLTVAIVGDMLHSRVGALEPPRAARARRARCGWSARRRCCRREFAALGVELHHDLADGVRGADVIMMLRIQRERQGAQLLPEPRRVLAATSASPRTSCAWRSREVDHPASRAR